MNQGFIPLDITTRHADMIFELSLIHRDPFDRMLIAQSRAEKFPILSHDRLIAKYDVDIVLA